PSHPTAARPPRWTTRRAIRVWDVTQRGKPSRLLRGPEDHVSTVAFTPDGRGLVSSAGNTLRSWDVASGKSRETWQFDAPIPVLAFSQDRKLLAVADLPSLGVKKDVIQYVTIWDVPARKKMASVATEPIFVSFGLGKRWL